jgi:hydroxypyruvate isomerase
VSGRNEIDNIQKINYAAIIKTIVATGYARYVYREFIPKNDHMGSLRDAISICDA